MAGFPPHPDVPMLYDIPEDYCTNNEAINSRFYSPLMECQGQSTIFLLPKVLIFNDPEQGDQLILKQICINFPCCKFIKFEMQNTTNEGDISKIDEFKQEPVFADEFHSELDIPIVKTEVDETASDNEDSDVVIINGPNGPITLQKGSDLISKCPECNLPQKSSMTEHFLKQNKPFDESLKCDICKFISPTTCSLQAHKRLHENMPPFICPECGREFKAYESLMEHLDEVCFHLAKQVRYRCPAKNCGKIFAQTVTYTVHFVVHILCISKCCLCDRSFSNKKLFEEHQKIHENTEIFEQLYKCTVCHEKDETFTENTFRQHVQWHCTDRSQCVYIYMCKYCRSYFRSTVTYATHLLRCSKREVNEERTHTIKKIIVTICFKCNYHIKMTTNQNVTICPRCGANFLERIMIKNKITDQLKNNELLLNCLLCEKQFNQDDLQMHLTQNECKYQNPVVVLNDDYEKFKHLLKDEDIQLLNTLNKEDSTSGDEIINETAAKDEISDFLKSKEGSSIAEKNLAADPEIELTVKEPTPFLGPYVCNHCNFSNEARKSPDRITVKEESVVLSDSPKSEESVKKKRKKTNLSPRTKKLLSTEPEVEFTVEEPIPFDGIYYCKLCNFSSDNRNNFHEHIVLHRDISTSYQCMECGDCFVVKPSLCKHLIYYHQIHDVDKYFEENNCFDKEAVSELQEMIKLAPCAIRERVEKNQCRVCLEVFKDNLELKKHYRVHGMAFLMLNSK